MDAFARLGRVDRLPGLDAPGCRVSGTTVRPLRLRLAVEDDRLTGVHLVDGRGIRRAAVLLRPSNVPHTDGLLTGLGGEPDDAGFPVVVATGRTSAAVLPTLTVLDVAMGTLLEDVPIVLRTFVLATVAVAIVMYGLMPRLHQLRVRLLVRRAC